MQLAKYRIWTFGLYKEGGTHIQQLEDMYWLLEVFQLFKGKPNRQKMSLESKAH